MTEGAEDVSEQMMRSAKMAARQGSAQERLDDTTAKVQPARIGKVTLQWVPIGRRIQVWVVPNICGPSETSTPIPIPGFRDPFCILPLAKHFFLGVPL